MASKDTMELEYIVSVTNLEAVAAQAQGADKATLSAANSMNTFDNQSRTSLRTILMTVRSVNAARLAIQQTSKAFTEFNLQAAMYGFLNMIQVVYNLSSLLIMLRRSQASAGAAQAVLATLTGQWWLIPLALAAGALVYSRMQSYQKGGPVLETGIYQLHKGEYVVPASQMNRFGPIFVMMSGISADIMSEDPRRLLDVLGPEIINAARRG